MSGPRALFVLVTIGAAIVALALFVLIRNKSPDDEVLAVIGLLGGIAVVLNAARDR